MTEEWVGMACARSDEERKCKRSGVRRRSTMAKFQHGDFIICGGSRINIEINVSLAK